MALTRRKFVKVGAQGTAGIVLLSSLPQGLAFAGSGGEEGCSASPLQGSPTTLASTDDEDVLLAVFTNSENDSTDTFYMSVDGYHFEKISEAFVNLDPNDPNNDTAVGSYEDGRTWPLYSFKCPSLIYHNGYFWMLANESNGGDNGTLRLVISNSKDLVHWCDQRQVQVSVPSGYTNNGAGTYFDAVAADWAVGPDGNVYVAVSLGYYGAFHGNAENDTMYPYMVKITELSAINDPAVDPILNDSSYITVRAEQARPINLPQANSNRIDGSWYFEDGIGYLSIKVNGVTNEIWRISNMGDVSNSSAWSLVDGNVVTGYEAPCLTKKNSLYYMYTDQLATWTPDSHVREPYFSTGTFMQMSESMSSGWTTEEFIKAYNKDYASLARNNHNAEYTDGPRHGTVIFVTDSEAKKVIWERRDACGWWAAPIRFNDADDPNAYYFDSVSYMAQLGLITGFGPYYTTFGVGSPLNRSQMVTILWRYCQPDEYANYDEPNAKNTSGLPDVPDGTFYTAAVNWAVKEGVVTGNALADGTYTFAPDDDVNFEQMITIVARYVLGGTEEATDYDPSALDNGPFTDKAAVSDYARGSVAWAIGNGIVTGYDLGDGTYSIAPQESVARERAATILARAIQGGLIEPA